MTAPTLIKVSTLTEYTGAVEQHLVETRKRCSSVSSMNWYRGHGKSKSHTLTPTLYRHPNIKKINDLLDLEVSMIDSFQRESMLHDFQASSDPASRMKQLFYMQHNGVPTRLLDWSNNPYIALYFALSDARLDEKTKKFPEAAAVWLLDPTTWNSHSLSGLNWGDKGPASSDDADLKTYKPLPLYSASDVLGMYPAPVAVFGAPNTQRMLAQRGVFTMFGTDTRPMEVIYKKEAFPKDCLVKLEIPIGKIDSMLSMLLAIGYTDSVAYPDLQGLALEIRRLHGFKL